MRGLEGGERCVSHQPISLLVPIGDSDDTSFGDFIEDKAADNPMQEAGFPILKDKIKEVLDTLTEREREVLEQRFGLKDGYSRTLEEVGGQFQVTRERIRQIGTQGPSQNATSLPHPDA